MAVFEYLTIPARAACLRHHLARGWEVLLVEHVGARRVYHMRRKPSRRRRARECTQ